MMDKRTLWVVLACMLVLFGLQAVVNKIYPPIPKKPKPVSTNAATVATNIVEAIKPAPVPVEKSNPLAPEKIVSLSNEFVRVEFTSWGGGIRLVELLKHRANTHGHAVLNGPEFTPALSLAGGSNDVFEIQQQDAQTVVLRDAGGITKTFSLSNNYIIVGSILFPNGANAVSLEVGTATRTQRREPPNYLVVDWQGASKFRNRTQPRVADREKTGKNHEEIRAGWVAVKSQYFAMVLTPATNVTGVTYSSVTVSPEPPPIHGVRAAVDVPVTQNADGTATCTFTYYAGPKDYDQLVALGRHQDEILDFGTPLDFYTGFFGVVLVRTLGFFYRLIPNYGVAIILVTIVLKIVFWPIQAKSIKSMKEMQKFQPLMQKVREKYKDDPQRMNQELWKLQREHGINPAAGCLPMLVQLPVLIGFYRVLVSDIALRGASFFWIKDLSQPDTVWSHTLSSALPLIGHTLAINPLPLIMTLTQIWQQRLTPTGGDPQQQKMMMFMPVVMLFLFYNMASGLTLYWTLQQLLSILQQWWGMRHDKKGGVPVPAGKLK